MVFFCATLNDMIKALVPIGGIFIRLCTIEINSAIANNLKPIGMIKMQCLTIYPNIYARLLNCLYRKQSEKYSAKGDRDLTHRA